MEYILFMVGFLIGLTIGIASSIDKLNKASDDAYEIGYLKGREEERATIIKEIEEKWKGVKL
jgi:hypothetical protein